METTRASGRSEFRYPAAVRAMCALALFTLFTAPAGAAGGVGHFYIATAAAERIASSPDVPEELRDALKDASCLNAFRNGAIAPDLACLAEMAHYGDTMRIPGRLIDVAEEAFDSASRLPDSDPSRAGKMKEAMKALCFACGWLSHCAADVAVHPKVNARAGDAYEYCDKAQKGIHTAAEVQLSKYLQTALRTTDKISFDIPYWLVAKASGVSEQQLQASVKTMRMKLIGELALMGQVKIPIAELRKEWHDVGQKCVSDTVLYIADPDQFRGYGLDYGPISTADFRGLREECIGINDGRIPTQWGREYMNWWNLVRHLPADQRHARLVELIKGRDTEQAGKREVVVKTTGPIAQLIWVNDTEIVYGKNHVIRVPKSGLLKIRVLCESSSRRECNKKEYVGENVRVLEQSPYILHYTSRRGDTPYEYHLSLVEETYTWQAREGKGTVYSSGVHPKVKNDMFDWAVPVVKKTPGSTSRAFTVDIECKQKWYTFHKSGAGVAADRDSTGPRPSVLGTSSSNGQMSEATLDESPRMSLVIYVEGE